MQDNIAVLREWIAGSDNIVFFRRRGRVHGIRHPGFPQHGRAVPAGI